MSLLPTAPPVTGVRGVAPPVGGAPRRVRHQARDVVAVMAFSAVSSSAVAAAFLLVAHLYPVGR